MRKLTVMIALLWLTAACAAPPAAETATGPEATGAAAAPPEAATEAPATEAPATGAPAGPTRFPPEKYADLRIVTLLPPDAIPAIDNPSFLSAAEADEYYDPDELVLGVEFDGDARAYSIPLLSSHEIVNDMVGGVKIAVTW